MNRALAILGIGVTMPIPATTQAEVWTTIARSAGVAVPCSVATNQAQLDKLLNTAGWSMYGRRAPNIDFSKALAVIVAPGKFQANSDLKLVSQNIEAGERVVRWGFVVRPAQGLQREGMADFSSQANPDKEILVVTFPLSQLGRKQSCIGPY